MTGNPQPGAIRPKIDHRSSQQLSDYLIALRDQWANAEKMNSALTSNGMRERRERCAARVNLIDSLYLDFFGRTLPSSSDTNDT